MSDDENNKLDEEIVDRERAAELEELADQRIFDLDCERRFEDERAERAIERQLADLERESGLELVTEGKGS